MPKVTIDVSNDTAQMIEKMMKKYSEQSGRPAPTLQTAVASFFVVGLRDSISFRENGLAGLEFGKWVPREPVE